MNNTDPLQDSAMLRLLAKVPFGKQLTEWLQGLAPGKKSFLANLSIVSVCFALSKVFSIVLTIIFTYYLGTEKFGEANIVMRTSQVLSMLMLTGFHVSLMRYGSGQDNPAPVIATMVYCTLAGVAAVTFLGWFSRGPFLQWLELTDLKAAWAIAIAAFFSIYTILTSGYQALGLFRHRGLIELAFAALLLPALYLGHLLIGKNYQTLLLTYAVAYGALVPVMVWRFRHLLSPRYLFPPNTREMLVYGVFAGLSNIGFILMFAVQPMQLLKATNESTVGIFNLYSLSSIQMATFATGIFYAVFFPKVSASKNRPEIWRMLTRAWTKAMIPVFVLFASVLSVTLFVSSDEFPYLWTHVLLFSAVSTVITIHSTYGQILSAQGVKGARWTVGLSALAGLVNVVLSHLIIPHLGITGAVLTLLISYLVLLFGTILLKDIIKHEPDFEPEPGCES